MKFTMVLTMKRLGLGCLGAGALVAAACTEGSVIPTGPSASAAMSGLAATAPAASPRSGVLHVTKECSEYTGLAGSFCTITSSNVKEIEVDSKVFYAKAGGATSLDSDVVLDPPGPGNNTASGHCRLEFATGVGLCTFSGGTGKFTHFHASANVSYLGGPTWAWDGTYSFSPSD